MKNKRPEDAAVAFVVLVAAVTSAMVVLAAAAPSAARRAFKGVRWALAGLSSIGSLSLVFERLMVASDSAVVASPSNDLWVALRPLLARVAVGPDFDCPADCVRSSDDGTL